MDLVQEFTEYTRCNPNRKTEIHRNQIRIIAMAIEFKFEYECHQKFVVILQNQPYFLAEDWGIFEKEEYERKTASVKIAELILILESAIWYVKPKITQILPLNH